MRVRVYGTVIFMMFVLLLVGCTKEEEAQNVDANNSSELTDVNEEEIVQLKLQIDALQAELDQYDLLIDAYEEKASQDVLAIKSLMDNVTDLNFELAEMTEAYNLMIYNCGSSSGNAEDDMTEEACFANMDGDLNTGMIPVNAYELDVAVTNIPSSELLEAVTVSNIDELLEAIRPNTKILLVGGSYKIDETTYNISNNPYLSYSDVNDGLELIISNVDNLILEGQPETAVQILTKPSYAEVLTFIECSGIQMKNLVIGHSDGPNECSGGVMKLTDCSNFEMDDCLLFGCGTFGITGESLSNMLISNCIFEKCTIGFMTMKNINNIEFNDCVFRETQGRQLFWLSDGDGIVFNSCEFIDNDSSIFFFSVTSGTKVCFYECLFENNEAEYFIFNNGVSSFPGCVFENNNFE